MHKAGVRQTLLTAATALLALAGPSGPRASHAEPVPGTASAKNPDPAVTDPSDADPLRPPVAAIFEPPPDDPQRAFLDPRDAFSLQDRKLLNRKLFDQLARPEQAQRLAAGNDFALATADLGIGTQVEYPSPQLAPFHGYIVLDAYAAVRVMDGVEVNLNLLTINRSASAGYRRGTDLFPGVAAHLEGELGRPGGRSLRGEFLTTDLGDVTLGKGLLIERVPLEGHAARLRWGDVIEINEVFGGEALWLNDDVQTLGLRLFDGALEVNAVTWLLNDVVRADYLTLAAEMPGLGPHFRLAGEAGLRAALSPSAPWAAAGMIRADVIDRHARHGGRWHLGYQFRAYQKDFGPRTGPLIPVQTLPALPTREDGYVTNPALYFNVSPLFDQWSHTVMLEVRAPLWWRFEFWTEAEWVLRFARDPNPDSSRVVYERVDRRFPGWHADTWLKTGIELRPFANLPHRARFLFSNKHVAAFGYGVPQSTGDQFLHQKLISLELEVFL